MSTIEDVILYTDVFSRENYNQIYVYGLNAKKWGLQRSHPNDQNIFLKMDLDEDFSKVLFPEVLKKIGNNFNLNRVYINGQYFGMPGYPHNDDNSPDAYTFLVYLNSNWDVLWGGQTIFMNKYAEKNGSIVKHNEHLKIVYPSKNLGVFFPSNLVHYAESPTKDCKQLRMTIAFKMIKIQQEDKIGVSEK